MMDNLKCKLRIIKNQEWKYNNFENSHRNNLMRTSGGQVMTVTNTRVARVFRPCCPCHRYLPAYGQQHPTSRGVVRTIERTVVRGINTFSDNDSTA